DHAGLGEGGLACCKGKPGGDDGVLEHGCFLSACLAGETRGPASAGRWIIAMTGTARPGVKVWGDAVFSGPSRSPRAILIGAGCRATRARLDR
ncbi:MAG: hypothetical protein ACK4UL_12325, partial [Novosphingobium meiothermophilum]